MLKIIANFAKAIFGNLAMPVKTRRQANLCRSYKTLNKLILYILNSINLLQ